MSQYIGLYVQVQNGTVYNVQVQDPYGNSLGLPPDEYVRRDIKPDISLLPVRA